MPLKNYQALRRKYPVFSFDRFEYHFENNALNIDYFYSCSEHSFVHKLVLDQINDKVDQIDKYIFNLGLSLLPSYWKLFCSPRINIQAGYLSPDETEWWHKLFIKGMGEYFYKNQIHFTEKDFLKITTSNTPPYPSPNLGEGTKGWSKNRVLVPVGGGKDSIVTLELLKPHFAVTAFVINPVPLISGVIEKAGIPAITVQNNFDPRLFELNRQGFLNGHVPVSAFYAFAALLTAGLHRFPYIAFSNEASSSEGNTTYLGHEINHQYSKTLEFESNLNHLISQSLNNSIRCFSFLRPLYELQITKLFSQYPQYFDIFSSCNNNFKKNKLTDKLWCTSCPKCVSTALLLACFIGKDQVSQIMGSFPPDLPENQKIIDELTGKSPVKPFECVLTRSEALACITGHGLEQILNSWQENPNMPEEFTEIIKTSINTTLTNSPS